MGGADLNFHEEVVKRLTDPRRLGIYGQPGGWWELAHGQVLRQQAWREIKGQDLADDPWRHLIQARGYRLIGEIENADAELAAAPAAAPSDPDVWLARARLFDEWDEQQRSAEAEWTKAIELAGDDPLPWIHRGRWYAERGEQEKADADFARAASLTPNERDKFFEAGWWVVGPYPANISECCPPELDSDLSRPVYTFDVNSGMSSVPVAWRSVSPPVPDLTVSSGLPALDNRQANVSVYGLTYIYAPEERSEGLLVGGDDQMRVWLNGQLVCETKIYNDWAWGLDYVPVTFRKGRNTLLVKVNNNGAFYFRVRLGRHPIDRGNALADFGLWEEALTHYREGFSTNSQDSTLWRQHALLLLLSRDREGCQAHCAQMLKRFAAPSDERVAYDLAMACGLAPEGTDDFSRRVDLAQMAQVAWAYGRRDALARAHLRAGQYQQAIAALDGRDWHGRSLAVYALAHHHLGNVEEARRWLAKLDAWYNEQTQKAIASPVFHLWSPKWWERAWDEICYWEAKSLIEGGSFQGNDNFTRLQARARSAQEQRSPHRPL